MLEKIVSDAMAHSLAEYRAAPDNWAGWDWWQLSPEESVVFDLAPERWAELVPVWQAFAFFTGRTDGWNEDKIERDYPDLDAVMKAAREQYPEWAGLDATAPAFLRFAQRFASVPYREAKAMFMKMDFWAVRSGVVWYADEWD